MEGSQITEAELRKQLKGANPVSIRVMLGDETVRKVAMSPTRNKWVKFLDVLGKLGPWSRLECLDKNDNVLGIVNNEAEAGDLEDLGVTGTSSEIMKMERVLSISTKAILQAQREVLMMRDRETVALMQSVGSVVKDLTGGMRVLQEMHAAQLDAAYGAGEQAAIASQAPARDKIEQATELIEGIAKAAPDVMPAIFMLLKSLGLDKLLPKAPAPAAKPPNGANGTPPNHLQASPATG